MAPFSASRYSGLQSAAAALAATRER
jgi:hypothetical protein